MTHQEIVKLLREIDAYARAGAGVPIRVWRCAGEVADAVEQMENEIARLREERMTNEERGAISWATAALLYDADKTWPAFRERSQHSREAAKTLKGLLERQPLASR